MHGVTAAIKFFQRDLPKLTESTVRPCLKKYRDRLHENSSGVLPAISAKRGRPLLLPDEIDQKLCTFIDNTRKAGGTLNKHVVYGILMGLIKSDLARYGRYLDFVITNSWLQSLYKRMNFTRRMVACYHTIDVVGSEGEAFTPRYCVSNNRKQYSR